MITFTTGIRTRITVQDCNLKGIYTTELQITDGIATVTCPCCQGEGEHLHGRGPYTDSYPCDPCNSKGHFQVSL